MRDDTKKNEKKFVGVILKLQEYEVFKKKCDSLGLGISATFKKMLLNPDFLYIDHARLLQVLAVIAEKIAAINLAINTHLIPYLKTQDLLIQGELAPLIERYIHQQAKLEKQLREVLTRIP